MKIYYIANARIPTEKAHGYQICKMCEEFSAAGANMELWVPTRKNSIQESAFQYYGLKENFRIKYIKSFDFIKYDKLLFRKSVYLQSLWFFLKLVFKKIDKNAIIYTRNPEIVWLFNLRGMRTVYECHDWFDKKKRIALMLLRACGYIITTNNFIKQEFIKHGFGINILLAPNGVNLEIFALNISRAEALEKLDISPDLRKQISEKKILLYTGSFRTMGADKGIDEIISALKKINQKNIIFIAVGGNEADIAHYENIAKKAGAAEICVFRGRVKQAELALWQRAADILLMPFPDKAHYRYFMTPLKIFEYMAGGRPIIASDLPSIREIMDEDTAIFCKPGDADDLKIKIEYVLNNQENMASKTAGCIPEFSWSKRAERILQFIQDNK